MRDSTYKMDEDGIEFLAFGYSCTLFSDDEKAKDVVNGAYLVPWNGDKELLIDRFDCRGYLTNITEYDSKNLSNSTYEMSEEETLIESDCDRERYLDLHVDVQEEAINAEEQKRYDVQNQKTYGAVNYSYDLKNDVREEEVESTVEVNPEINRDTESPGNDIPYELPIDLPMPEHIVLPTLDKEAIIIEKTADFIARQGAQMEIVLKTKQAGNHQFKFLDHGHYLNPFYKELVRSIRTGMYIPKLRQHTSTLDTHGVDSAADIELKLPKVDISETSYAALINKFKPRNKKVTESVDQVENPKTPENDCVENSSSEEKWQQKYREYYEHYYQYYYTHYYNTQGSSLDQATLVEKAANDAAVAAMAAVDAIRKAETAASDIDSLKADMTNGQCVIIDKMADYVVRNGNEFESVVYNQKGTDPLFLFLQPTHKYHAYYLAKRRHCRLQFESDKKAEALGNKSSENSPSNSVNGKTDSPTNFVSTKMTKGNKGSEDDYPNSDGSDDEYELHPLLLGSSAPVDVSSEDVTIPGRKENSPKKDSTKTAEDDVSENLERLNSKPTQQITSHCDVPKDREKLEKFHRKLDDHMQATKRKHKRKSVSPKHSHKHKVHKYENGEKTDNSNSNSDNENNGLKSSKSELSDRMKERRLKAAQLVAKLNAKKSNILPPVTSVALPVPENVPAAVAAALTMNGTSLTTSKTDELMQQLVENSDKTKSMKDKSTPIAYSRPGETVNGDSHSSRHSKKSKKHRRRDDYSEERRSRKEKKSRRRSRS